MKAAYLYLLALATAHGIEADAGERRKAARERYAHIKSYAEIPKDLLCATCHHTATLLQQVRAAAVAADPKDKRNLFLSAHLQKMVREERMCDEFQFQGFNFDPFDMEIVCHHVTDHWDWAGEDADTQDKDPWFHIKKLLPQVEQNMGNLVDPSWDGRLLESERTALCNVGKGITPCGINAKDEL